MMKSLSLTLLSLVVALLSHSPTVYGGVLFSATPEAQEDTADGLATARGLRHHKKGGRGGGGRGGGNRGGGGRGGRFHDQYEGVQYVDAAHEEVEDYALSHPDHEYLPEDVTPYPFQNCVPESFRVGRGHTGEGHHHHGGPRHHHHNGGPGHNHPGKHHQMMNKGATGRGADDDAYYNGRSKGSKGKGKAGMMGSKGGKGGRSKGTYYGQRTLYHRGNNRHGAMNQNRNGGGAHAPKHHKMMAAKQRQQPFDDDFAAIGGDDDAVRQARFAPLPLCPSTTPIRNTFNPVPTLPPRDGDNSAAPGESPTDGMTGGAPVDIPPGTDRVFVESYVDFGFFDDTTPRAPTQAEIDGLLVETTRFYTAILQARFPNLVSFDATFVATNTDLASENPVRIDFDANAFFTTGTAVPSAAEVFEVLEAADYQGTYNPVDAC